MKLSRFAEPEMCVPEWLNLRGGLDIVDKIQWMWTGFCVIVILVLLLLVVALVRTGITIYKLYQNRHKKDGNEVYEMGNVANTSS